MVAINNTNNAPEATMLNSNTFGTFIGNGIDRREWLAVARNHLKLARAERARAINGRRINFFFHAEHLRSVAAARVCVAQALPFTAKAGDHARQHIGTLPFDTRGVAVRFAKRPQR